MARVLHLLQMDADFETARGVMHLLRDPGGQFCGRRMRIGAGGECAGVAESGRKFLVEQLQRGCLSARQLVVKKGAAVMFTKNNAKGGFVNGTLGTVVDFSRRKLPIVETRTGEQLEAEPMEWTVEDDGRVFQCTFVNQQWAAIGNYRGSGNAFRANDYSGIAPGAEPVSTDHLSSFREG
jgi:hypothetical protein